MADVYAYFSLASMHVCQPLASVLSSYWLNMYGCAQLSWLVCVAVGEN